MADAVQPQHGGGEGPEPEVKPQETPLGSASVEVSKSEENKATTAPVEVFEKSPKCKPDEAKTTEIQSAEAKVEETKSDEVKVEIKPEEVKVELIPNDVNEIKSDEAIKPQIEEVTEAKEGNGNEAVEQNSVVGNDADWKDREAKLLKIINDLEKVKNEKSEDSLKLELKLREEEVELLRARVNNLETELQAALSKPTGKNHEMIENIKQQHEELLSKARGMIFDKTKMVKNQELQIEALTTQVQSLKDVNMITKDLLEIRNSEIKAMEERLQAMEARFKAEKDRFGLVLERAQTSTNINTDLRKEYETQLNIFKELRSKYDQRVQALVAENERLKASVNGVSST